MAADAPIFLVLCFDHPLRAVESVADSMAAGLRTLGIDARVLSLPRDNDTLAGLLRGPISGALSLGPLPLATQVGGAWLHRKLACPVWLYFLDAPIYDLARVPVTRVFLDDALNDARLVPVSPEGGYQALLGRRAQGGFFCDQALHLPFAGFAKLVPAAPRNPPQPRLCVIGTIGGELGGGKAGESLGELLVRSWPKDAPTTARTALAEAIVSPEAPAMPAQAVMHTLQWSPAQMVDAAHLPFLCALDSWVKRERRLAAVKSLAGLPVDFYGNGWQQILGEVPGFRYVGNVRHDDIATLTAHYLAVLNFDPNWAQGVHDRVYTALQMGVHVLTNDNSALDGAQLPGELLHVYDANRPALAGSLRALLEGPIAPPRPRADMIGAHGWSERMARLVSSR